MTSVEDADNINDDLPISQEMKMTLALIPRGYRSKDSQSTRPVTGPSLTSIFVGLKLSLDRQRGSLSRHVLEHLLELQHRKALLAMLNQRPSQGIEQLEFPNLSFFLRKERHAQKLLPRRLLTPVAMESKRAVSCGSRSNSSKGLFAKDS
jgi:hypothetical protein